MIEFEKVKTEVIIKDYDLKEILSYINQFDNILYCEIKFVESCVSPEMYHAKIIVGD